MKKLFLLMPLTAIMAACSDCNDCDGWENRFEEQMEVLVFNAAYVDHRGMFMEAMVAMNPDATTRVDGEPDIRVLLDAKGEYREQLMHGSMGSDGKTLLFSLGDHGYRESHATYSYHIPDGRLRLIYGGRNHWLSSASSSSGPSGEYDYGFWKPLYSPSMHEIYGVQWNVLSTFHLGSYLKTPLFEEMDISDYSLSVDGRELYVATMTSRPPQADRQAIQEPQAAQDGSAIRRLNIEGRRLSTIKELPGNCISSIDRIPGRDRLAYSETLNYFRSGPIPDQEPAQESGDAISTITLDGTTSRIYHPGAPAGNAVIWSVTVNRDGRRFAWIESAVVEESRRSPDSPVIKMGRYDGSELSDVVQILESAEYCDCIQSVRFAMIDKELFNSLPQLSECGDICE